LKKLNLEENNFVKGFVSGNKYLEKYDCEISGLYVEPEFQKNRIGSKLMNYMKTFFKNMGYKSMIIWTIKGLQNNSFYQRHGGEILEEKDLDYGGKMYPGIGFVFKI
jgi:GNAT superfamily N-acetyltransferase